MKESFLHRQATIFLLRHAASLLGRSCLRRQFRHVTQCRGRGSVVLRSLPAMQGDLTYVINKNKNLPAALVNHARLLHARFLTHAKLQRREL